MTALHALLQAQPPAAPKEMARAYAQLRAWASKFALAMVHTAQRDNPPPDSFTVVVADNVHRRVLTEALGRRILPPSGAVALGAVVVPRTQAEAAAGALHRPMPSPGEGFPLVGLAQGHWLCHRMSKMGAVLALVVLGLCLLTPARAIAEEGSGDNNNEASKPPPPPPPPPPVPDTATGM